jgi:hypothetical protein
MTLANPLPYSAVQTLPCIPLPWICRTEAQGDSNRAPITTVLSRFNRDGVALRALPDLYRA